MTFQPALEPFSQTYEAGLPQVVWTRLIDDLAGWLDRLDRQADDRGLCDILPT